MNEKIIKKLIFVNLFLCFSTFAKEYFVQVFPVTLHENKVQVLLGKHSSETFWKALGGTANNPAAKTTDADSYLKAYTEYGGKIKVTDEMLWKTIEEKENDYYSVTYIYLVPVDFQPANLLSKEGVEINQLVWVTLDEVEQGKFGQDETIDPVLVEFVRKNKSAILDTLKKVLKIQEPKPISLEDLANDLSQLLKDLLKLDKKLNLLGE